MPGQHNGLLGNVTQRRWWFATTDTIMCEMTSQLKTEQHYRGSFPQLLQWIQYLFGASIAPRIFERLKRNDETCKKNPLNCSYNIFHPQIVHSGQLEVNLYAGPSDLSLSCLETASEMHPALQLKHSRYEDFTWQKQYFTSLSQVGLEVLTPSSSLKAKDLPLTTTAMSTKSISPRASTLASQRYTPSSALVTWWICRLLFSSTWNLPGEKQKHKWNKEEEGEEITIGHEVR